MEKKIQKRNRFLNNNNVLCVRTTDNDIDHQNILYSVPPPIRRNVRTEENQKTPTKAQKHGYTNTKQIGRRRNGK